MLLCPTAGRARLLGRDVVGEPLAGRRRIGLAGQFAAVDAELTERENVELIGRLYRLPGAEARARAAEVRAPRSRRRGRPLRVHVFRRLDLGATLVGRPPVVLLDEPSTGLDPRTRQELWSIVDELRREGTTVLLTTQYLEEADRLARRIAVVDRGRIAARGTAAQLKANFGGNVLSVRLADPDDVPAARAALADLAACDQPRVDADDGEIRLPIRDSGASAEAVRCLDAHRLAIAAVELQQPSLDDVFLKLTGRPAEHSQADLGREAA